MMRARELYEGFCQETVPVSGIREAEMSKLLENTYRHVNIALMNEMSIFCKELEIDLWEVIRAAATKPFGFQAFHPGPGVGGHCIPIDPSYLSYRVKQLGYPFRFVELASEINDRMPGYVVQRIGRMLNGVSLPFRGSKVLLVGVAYKANVTDTRESPAIPIASQLAALGARVAFIDPVVDEFSPEGQTPARFTSVADAGDWCDVAVVLAPHDGLDLDLLISTADLVFDTRGVAEGTAVEHL
jgi:nucleotide sugar dehydrogenase